jgi:putative membrane protein
VTGLALGVLALGALWLGPLPALAERSFAAHMALHMGVVAVAAPLLALSFSGKPLPALLSPVPLSALEAAVVWAWHAPALHHAARHAAGALALEQASFLGSGLLVWAAALGRGRAGAGAAALLLTSTHMTLLGALFALAPRPLYGHHALADQHLGGVVMLLVGGASYLLGGLWLVARLLRER